MSDDWRVASNIGHVPLVWVLLPLMLGYVLGVEVGEVVSPAWLVTSALAVMLVVVWVTWCGDRWGGWRVAVWKVGVVMAVIMLGWAYWQMEVRKGPELGDLPPREVEVELLVERYFGGSAGAMRVNGVGLVEKAPQLRRDLEGESVYFSAWSGKFREEMVTGVKVVVRGRLSAIEREGGSDFDVFLWRRGVFYRLDAAEVRDVVSDAPWYQQLAFRLNRRFCDSLQTGATTEATKKLAGISEGMLLGRKQALDRSQRERFLESGTMHLFAVSGLHVGVIAGALGSFFALLRLPRRFGAVLGLALILIYVLVVGAPTSAVRAFLMTAFFWVALAVVRKPAPLPALVASALVVLLWEPVEMLGPGFQLSYAVVGGILLYGLPLGRSLIDRYPIFPLLPESALSRFQRGLVWLWRGVLGSGAVSFAATLFSAPLTIRYFDVFTPGAVPLNMVMLPLASVSIVTSAVAMVCGSVGLGFLAIGFNYFSWGINYLLVALVDGALWVPLFYSEVSWRHEALATCSLWLMIVGFAVALHAGKVRMFYFAIPGVILAAFLVIGVKFVQ